MTITSQQLHQDIETAMCWCCNVFIHC